MTAYSFELRFNSDMTILDFEITDGSSNTVMIDTPGELELLRLDYHFPGAGPYYLHCKLADNVSDDSMSDYTMDVIELGPAPSATLTATPDFGQQPLAVTFTISDLLLPEGTTLEGYEWDLNGDFYFERGPDTGNEELAKLFAAGMSQANVRILLDSGASGIASTEINVEGINSESEPNNTQAEAQELPAFPFTEFYGDLGRGGTDGSSFDYYKADIQGTNQGGQETYVRLLCDESFGQLWMLEFDAEGDVIEASFDNEGYQVLTLTEPDSRTVWFVVGGGNVFGKAGYLLDSVNSF
jgi:hypothetical protein